MSPDGAQSLTQLHSQLKALTQHPDPDTTTIKQLKQSIQTSLPAADTGGARPQAKTPAGQTRVLHMNYTRNLAGETVEAELQHLNFFAQTAQELGLRLEILTDPRSQGDVAEALAGERYAELNYQVTVSPKPVSKWAEDSVEYLANGRMAVLNQFDDELLAWAMGEGRRQRWQGKVAPEYLEAALRDDHLWILLAMRVNELAMGDVRKQVAQASAESSNRSAQAVGHLRAYIEGGNMITGEDTAGQPVVLVGRDAIATTANLYQLTDDAVRQAIAEDFGLANPAQVIPVEQPGKFHLDMGLLFLGHGVVVLNDSSKALQDAIEMAELAPCETTEIRAARLQLQCALEAAAAADLETAKLAVKRESLEQEVFYNFFNGEFVQGNDGLNYYITNGGPQEQQERFEALMVQQWQVVERVMFSPWDAAQKSLKELGGVGCRLKGSRK